MTEATPGDSVVAVDDRLISLCGGCGAGLALLAPIAHTRAVPRACGQCAAVVFCADTGNDDHHAGAVTAGDLPFHQRSRLRAAIARLLGPNQPGVRLSLPVTATPLDELYAVLGPTVAGEASDLAEQWVRFTLPTDRHAGYWLLDFGPSGHAGLQVAVRCETASPVGDGSWRIGGAPA